MSVPLFRINEDVRAVLLTKYRNEIWNSTAALSNFQVGVFAISHKYIDTMAVQIPRTLMTSICPKDSGYLFENKTLSSLPACNINANSNWPSIRDLVVPDNVTKCFRIETMNFYQREAHWKLHESNLTQACKIFGIMRTLMKCKIPILTVKWN